MSSQNSDIGRVLGAMGAPDMAYRSFAAEPLAARESEGTGAAAADPAELFPLLAAALPGSLGAMPAPPARAEAAIATAPIVPAPAAPVAAAVAPPPPAPPPAPPAAFGIVKRFRRLVTSFIMALIC